jgi:hypothetical protein
VNFSFCRICVHRTERSAGQANEYRTKLNWAEEGRRAGRWAHVCVMYSRNRRCCNCEMIALFVLGTTCNIYTVVTTMHGSLIIQQVVPTVTTVFKMVILGIRYSALTHSTYKRQVSGDTIVFLYYNHTKDVSSGSRMWGVWTGSSWLRMWTGGGHLCMR